MNFGKALLSCAIAIGAAGCTKRSEDSISIAYPSSGAIMNTQIGLILEKTDILQKHGFKAQISSMGTGRELKTALVSGKADVILTTETNFPVLLGEGFGAVALGSLGSAGRIGLAVRKDSFKSLKELRGKTIATIFGTSVHEPAVKWGKEAGANLINMGSIAAMQSALRSEDVDAIVSWDPYLSESAASGQIEVLKDTGFDLITVAARAFAESRPQAVVRLNEALVDAVLYLRSHRDEINADFARISNLKLASIHAASSKNANYSGAAIPSLEIGAKFVERLQASADFLAQESIVRERTRVVDHIWKAR